MPNHLVTDNTSEYSSSLKPCLPYSPFLILLLPDDFPLQQLLSKTFAIQLTITTDKWFLVDTQQHAWLFSSCFDLPWVVFFSGL